jgi:predicted esterase
MHQKNTITAGRALSANSKVLILLHGRGGNAEGILSLAAHLPVLHPGLVTRTAVYIIRTAIFSMGF